MLQLLRRGWKEWLHLKERQGILLSLLLISFSTLLALYIPKLAGDFIDKLELVDDEGALMTLVVCITLQQVTYGIANLFLNLIAERIALRLRTKTFSALIKKPQSYFDSTSRQKMLQATLADIDAIRTVISYEISQFLERVLTVVGGFVAIIFVSPLLAFYTALIAPVIALTLSLAGERIVYPLEVEARGRVVDVSEAADESFNNSQIVRSFGMEKAVVNRFQIPAFNRFVADRKAALGLTIFRGLIYYIAGMALLAACWYGRIMVRDEKSIQSGDLIAFLVYAVQIAVSLANSTRGLAVINLGVSCANSTFQLLDEEDHEYRKESGEFYGNGNGNGNGDSYLSKPCEELRFDNVVFAYPTPGRNEEVLKGINLTLRRGRSIALVGPSGAGKSSMISLVEKFYSPTNGRILVDDVNLEHISARAWRNRIGLVTQDACLFNGTIAENIALGMPDCEVPWQEIQRAAAIAHVTEFSKDLPLGLDTHIGHRGSHLSAGQRQRVAVARAIIRDPHVLLLGKSLCLASWR